MATYNRPIQLPLPKRSPTARNNCSRLLCPEVPRALAFCFCEARDVMAGSLMPVTDAAEDLQICGIVRSAKCSGGAVINVAELAGRYFGDAKPAETAASEYKIRKVYGIWF